MNPVDDNPNVIAATTETPAHQPATAEEVRADIVKVDGQAADPADADLKVEAEAAIEIAREIRKLDGPLVDIRNPRSDAEGAHKELQPAKKEAEEPELNPHHAAPPSAPPAPIVAAAKPEGTGDQRDTSKLDSVGNVKGDPAEEAPEALHGSGPRGVGAPNESLEAEEKRLRDRIADIRAQRGMSSTDQVDSIGNAQHVFKQEEQGHDKHGMRIPDKSTGEIVETAPVHVGPRGAGAPPDTFHGKRPNGRS